MRNLIIAIAVFTAMTCLAFAGGGDNEHYGAPPAATAPVGIPAGLAISALAQTAAAIGAMQTPDVAPQWLGESTCYIWEQPGVALAITHEWHTNTPLPEVWISADKLGDCLAAMPNLKYERPPLYITEEFAARHGGVDGELYLRPAVYLLDAPAAAERIAMHADGLQAWAEMNSGMDFTEPSTQSLAPACAVVYLDGSGPLEFYFTQNADGSLSLAHIIFFDFFSA